MRYRLGLDVGTDSIGWAVVALSDDNRPGSLTDMGVRIFSGGRDPKSHESLAVQRRLARGMRRMRDRRNSRKKAVIFSLVENGLMPADNSERKDLQRMNPVELRRKALDSRLEPYELGRALFHLSLKRGFRSNRTSGDPDGKKIAAGISALDDAMKLVGARTLGEFMCMRMNNGLGTKFRGTPDFPCYPSRAQLEKEFGEIRKVQSEWYDVDWDSIHGAIFHQRPLKAQERGRCRFYPGEYRAYCALPSSERFRILSDINNLAFTDNEGNSFTLSGDEKDRLCNRLDDCAGMNFSAVRKFLGIDASCTFNLETDKRKALKGNAVCSKLRDPEYFGSGWDDLEESVQDDIVETLICSDDENEIRQTLAPYGLDEKNIRNIISVTPPKTVSMLSSRFMRECSKVMRDRHVGYSEATAILGFDQSADNVPELDCLPYYGMLLGETVTGAHPEAENANDVYRYGKISNPTVHIALGQIRRVVNALMERYGKPTQIVIEMARDIADGPEAIAEKNRKQAENTRNNERIRKEISELTGISNPSRNDILKYSLWEELGENPLDRRCPYCGKMISGSELFSKAVEVDHILPYSRTLLDSRSNLILAHSHCNLLKLNRSPYEAFGHSPDGYDWSEIFERSRNLPGNKRGKFNADAMEKFEKDGGFLSRQLNDNRYIAKAARKYLSCICNDIWCVNGRNTAILRGGWGLSRLLNSDPHNNSKNRNDHRHHSIDALVIALTDRSMIKAMADMNVAAGNLKRFNVPPFPFPVSDVTEKLKGIIVSYRQEHGHSGRIYKETAAGLRTAVDSVRLEDLSGEMLPNILDRDVRQSIRRYMSCDKTFNKAVSLALDEYGHISVPVKRYVWTTTVPLASIDDKDIANDRIFNSAIREYVRANTSDVIGNKTELKKRLEEIGKKLGIRRVRYIPNSQAFEKVLSCPNKGYERDEVCFVTVWRVPKKNGYEYRGQFISYKEVYEHDSGKLKEYPKPHPAAKKVATLYKGDVIRIRPNDGSAEYLAIVRGYSTTLNQIDIRPLQAGTNISQWVESVDRSVTPCFDIWKDAKGSQNMKSINVLFSKNNVKPVMVSPDGRIECCGE